ncbi:GNAT family N-acetyltransferase [Angustibacter speluncae]
MSLQVERLGPDEATRFRRLRLTALQADPDAFYRTHAEEVDHPTTYWEGWLSHDDAPVVVAVLDGHDVGLAGLVPDRHAEGELAVVAFWVAPVARGRGVGRALLDDLEARARAAGAAAMTLEVADANDAAVRLYAAAGFEPTGHSGAFGHPREHVTEHERRKVLA